MKSSKLAIPVESFTLACAHCLPLMAGLKETNLFSSACAYGMTIAVSDGSGQYLSGSTSIAESYAGMRLEWRWAEKMSPTRPFLIAFGYDVAILWSLEIRHLRYLIAVAKALSFTQASAKLRLAQSSLTRQVSNLEDEIGARLLKQNHNRVAMTDQGQWFLFDSNRLLAMCAESVAAWQKLGFGESSQP